MPCVRSARSANGRMLLPAAMAATLSTSRPAQKAGALAGEHHGAQASIIFEPRAGFGDRSEHSRIEGVHLVGAIEPDIGDAVCDREPDAIFHGTISFLLLRTRRAWLHGATRAELGGVERSKTKRGAHCRDR